MGVPEEAGPADHYLADPQNFAEVYNRFDQDPNYQYEHYSREQINTLYNYYNYQNQGAPMDQWKPLKSDDEFVNSEMLKNNWYDPVKEEQAQQAQQNQLNEIQQIYNPTDPTKAAGFEQKPQGDWNSMDWVSQTFGALQGVDKGVLNKPGWTDKTAAAGQALSSAGAGAAALKIGASVAGALGGSGVAAAMSNPYVLAGAALAVGGLTFYEALTGKDIPVFNKFLELSDIVDTTVEKAIGFGAQAYQMGKGYFERASEDRNDAYGLMNAIDDTFKEVGQHAKSMWDTGEFAYEMFGSVDDFAIDVMKEIFLGKEGTKEGEAWFFNRGIDEKQQLQEGTYGHEGMTTLREMDEEMKASGIDDDTRKSVLNYWVTNVMGTSGFVGDYTMQAMLDLDILTTPIENEAMGVASRIGGSEVGIEATKANRGSMLTQLPVVGNIIQGRRTRKRRADSWNGRTGSVRSRGPRTSASFPQRTGSSAGSERTGRSRTSRGPRRRASPICLRNPRWQESGTSRTT